MLLLSSFLFPLLKRLRKLIKVGYFFLFAFLVSGAGPGQRQERKEGEKKWKKGKNYMLCAN